MGVTCGCDGRFCLGACEIVIRDYVAWRPKKCAKKGCLSMKQ